MKTSSASEIITSADTLANAQAFFLQRRAVHTPSEEQLAAMAVTLSRPVEELRKEHWALANKYAAMETQEMYPIGHKLWQRSKRPSHKRGGRPHGSAKTKAERVAAHRDSQAEYRRTERAKIQRKKRAAISAHRKAQAAKETRTLRILDRWNSRKSQVERVELDKELDREQKELLRQELYGQEASTDTQEEPDITDWLRVLGMRLRKAQGSEGILVNQNVHMPVKVNCKEIGSDT